MPAVPSSTGGIGGGVPLRACQRTYALHAGIPDFRVFPDPYLNVEEDRARTEICLLEELEKQHDLESLLDYYWSFSDVTPVPLRSKFVRSAMLSEGKAQRVLRLEGDTFNAPVSPQTTRYVLGIGSGTGAF